MLVGYSVSRVQDKANPKPVRPKAVWREGEGGEYAENHVLYLLKKFRRRGINGDDLFLPLFFVLNLTVQLFKTLKILALHMLI